MNRIARLLAALLIAAPSLATATELHLWQRFAVAPDAADSPVWQRLLHLRKRGELESHVRDPRFFLAENGRHDPRAELQANLRAFWSDDPAERQTRCRFPARYRWLAHISGREDPQGLRACEEYQRWRARMPAGKLTLVFPSYQLNSPSSMFGHTLLRADPLDTENHPTWLSQAINFGANHIEQDNSAAYAYKGITGGYAGSFSVLPYFHKIKEYGQDENRDIWEYPLDFSAAETDWLVTHLWELRTIEFGYYFFDYNCSYRLLELLEVARPALDLTEPFELTAIPVDTVRELIRRGIVTGRVFRPSQERQLHDAISRVPPVLRRWMPALRREPELAKSAEFGALDEPTRATLLQAAYGYTRYKDRDGDRASAARRIALLREIKALSPRAREGLDADGSRPLPPEAGHRSRRLQLGLREREDGEQEWLLSARMAFHSLDDNAPGYLFGAQINMLDLQLRHGDGRWHFDKLDLIDIASLVPSRAHFPHIAWQVKLGAAPSRLHQVGKSGAQLSAGAGYSRALGRHWAVYALVHARTEFDHRDGEFSAGIGPRVGALLRAGPLVGTLVAERSFSDGREIDLARASANLSLSRESSLALEAKRSTDAAGLTTDTLALHWRYFFN